MEVVGFQPADEVQAMFANPSAQGDGFQLLSELNKGLLSSNQAVQCSALVQFPRLFDLFPFPLTINTAAVRLSEVFMEKNTSNFTRYQILQVFQRSELHLGAIYTIDDVIKRVSSVIYSNDPIARALTLRMWGSMAPIIGEHKRIHHSILKCLGSSDQVEIDAAIYATARICTKSKTFAGAIAKKTFDMITKLETPTSVKLKLIPIFRHMHHSPDSINEARQVCLELLESYRTAPFVLCLLSTLSTLASHSLVHISSQMQLLCSYIEDDPRQAIQIHALSTLTALARRAPHMCSAATINVLLRVIKQSPHVRVQLGALQVILCLSTTITANHLLYSPPQINDESTMEVDGPISSGGVWGTCQDLLADKHDGISVVAAQILTNLLTSQSGYGMGKTLSCLLKILPAFREYSPMATKAALQVLTQLSGKRQGTMLCNWLETMEGRVSGSVSSVGESVTVIANILANTTVFENAPTFLIALSRLVFRIDHDQLLSSLRLVITTTNSDSEIKINERICSGWTAFCIARHAVCLGQHALAVTLFHILADMVASEHYFFWLHALERLSHAESSLANLGEEGAEVRLLSCLSAAQCTYPEAVASLKAANKPGYTYPFQLRFLAVRMEMLDAFSSLAHLLAAMGGSDPVPVLASR
eukprot:Ihof_evm2s488 gene=Ihof_evmTU2s488